MTSVITGNGMGLSNSTLTTLTGQGAAGNAVTGQDGSRVYINGTNGNLVIQRQDELLIGLGLDVGVVRTYNSQAQLDGDNNDGWRIGVYKKLVLTGTVNTAGSTVTRTDGDGNDTVYTYDTATGTYRNTDGAGACDTLSYSAGSWTWLDGSSRNSETYNAAGQLTRTTDTDGNTLDYTYTGNLITRIFDTASNQTTWLDYSGTQLSQIRTESNGISQIRTRYNYDAQGRLSQVSTDLTPEDNSIADGRVYTTTYTYDGTSTRISGISENGQAVAGFNYILVGSEYKVASFTDGAGRTTTLTYGPSTTTVTDVLQHTTELSYDTNNRLTQLTDGLGNRLQYGYNNNGDVTSITDARGNVTHYEYDANGNRTLSRDALGNTVTRTYGANNELLTESTYLIPDPDGAGAIQAVGPLTTHYVYDSENHLRYIISSEGRVTENRYNAAGKQSAVIQYTKSQYDVSGLSIIGLNIALSPSEAQLATWIGTLDKTQSTRTDYDYDFRGNIQSSTLWSAVDGNGNGINDGKQSVTQYIYDQSGQLLKRIAPNLTPDTSDYVTQYGYDGLGRLLSSSQWISATETRISLNQYDDANHQLIVTAANGLITTSQYDASGLLTSTVQSSGGNQFGTTRYYYDAAGRQRMSQDATGVRTYQLYDEANRKIADIDSDGSLTEYAYNANGQLTRTTHYATAVNVAQLVDAQGNPADVTLGAIRPQSANLDRQSLQVYDKAGRLCQVIDGLGYVTQNFYDGAGRLTDIIRYATPITLAGLPAAPIPDDISALITESIEDRQTRNFYGDDGELLGSLDGEGYLTCYQYDAAGRRTGSTGYANITSSGLRASGTLAQLIPASDAKDKHTYTLYNGKGQIAGTIEGAIDGSAPNIIPVTTSPVSITGSDITNNAANGWNNADVYSRESYTGKAYVSAVAGQTNLSGMFGLNSDPLTNKTYNTLDYAWFTASTGLLYIYENGSKVATLGTYTATDVLSVEYTGSSIIYKQNGVVKRTVAASGNRTFYFDSSLYHTGYTLRDIRFGADPGYLTPGYLTEIVYDQNGNKTSVIRYATPVTYSAGAGIAGVRPASNAEDQVTHYLYNGANQLTQATAADGTLSQYTYNSVGQQTSVTTAAGTGDTRTLTTRYDIQGRVMGELAGEGSALLTGNLTQAEIDAIWAQWGIRYTYDAAGRRNSSTDQYGNTSHYYYDTDNRLAYTVNAGGEVTQNTYNTLNQQSGSIRYGTRISTAGLTGGLVSSDLTDRIVADASLDSHTDYTYDKRGQLALSSDALGYTTGHSYDAFGEEITRISQLSASANLIEHLAYDKRGLLTQRITDPAGINRITSSEYDAFGRVIRQVDGNGNISSATYDNLGRQITTTDISGSRSTSYDAFGRTLTTTDALGNTTTYNYDTQTRSMVVTTPEGVSLTTVKNRQGETATVTDAAGNSTNYAYDKNGNLKTVTDAQGVIVTNNENDRAGRAILSTDGNGHLVATSYDSNGRILTRTTDPQSYIDGTGATINNPGGLNLQTRYEYDAQGRIISVTDANGSVTQTHYDAKGQITSIVQDPAGLNLVTTYSYDRQGHTLTKTEGANGSAPRVTQYGYDTLGRRITEQIDPAGLNLTTTYTYDKNGNVLSKTDANGNTTTYRYDGADRLIYTLDALNGLSQTGYDAEGRVIQSTRYAKALTGLPTDPGQITQTLIAAAIQADAADQTTRIAYDKDGRRIYTVDSLNGVTRNIYDTRNNVIEVIAYANPIPAGTANTRAAIQAAITTSSTDHNTRTIYNSLNQAIYAIDAKGYVTQNQYDAVGNVIAQTQYATPVNLSGNPTEAQIQAALISSGQDRTTRNVYDSANRVVYSVDALNYITASAYDNSGNLTQSTRYATAINLSGNPTQAQVLAALVTGSNDQTDTYTYDTAGRLTASQDAEGYTEYYQYDALGNKTAYTNKKGAYAGDNQYTWHYQYDAAGRLLQETTPGVDVTRLTQNADGSAPGANHRYADRAPAV